jgi:hypothetical protein
MFLYCHPLVKATLGNESTLLRLEQVLNSLPVLHRHIQDGVHVLDEICFDLLVDGGVVIEGGQVVHFEEPGFKLAVEHDVEAK